MSVYVVVHGGFYGGWAWRQVAQLLRTAGHEVFTPTLTGLGERAHLANSEVNLATHIQDINGVLECEDLTKVILVGHSSGSMVATGVAERSPERLSRLVYLDAPIPKNGQSWIDLLGPVTGRLILELAKNKGDGWRVPLVPNPPRWQPHPLKPLTDSLKLDNPAAVLVPRAFIHCTARSKSSALAPFWPEIDRAAANARLQGWWYRTLSTDHAPFITMPKELTALLLELA